MVYCSENTGLSSIFSLAPQVGTRLHFFKRLVSPCSTELRCRFRSVRYVAAWNNLPPRVVELTSINKFKSGLMDSLGNLATV